VGFPPPLADGGGSKGLKMDLLTVLFIALGLSMDAVAMAIGLKILLEHLRGG